MSPCTSQVACPASERSGLAVISPGVHLHTSVAASVAALSEIDVRGQSAPPRTLQ